MLSQIMLSTILELDLACDRSNFIAFLCAIYAIQKDSAKSELQTLPNASILDNIRSLFGAKVQDR